MGSFNDFRNASRESWKYEYSGAELLPYAKKKLEFYTRREMEVRQIMSKRLADPNIKSSGDKNEALRKKIEQFGAERERCLVFVHEFDRVPGKTYSLSLGDVTYFDISGIPSKEDPDEDDF